MTINEVIKEFNVIPHAFTLVTGDRFEHTTMQHSDGTWYAYIWKMKGGIRQPYSHAWGLTQEDAIKNLINKNS